ncbi:MAG: hypothetical protein LKM32_13860 [Chiayiivirga sp.]|jgi:predicted lipoprotein with Yx(FWY)xxD motif|uniref:COG4315 family predicted lipoprotein n=1 Tax=Chiayiivirga sp. TaxID=2041042 RepID=UPI0025BC626E|nr:hypothetical protein [Chiayiivirga sp.]MCI1709991.1 hypothetical protein [Chiayiivirga sp.]MCI1730415.1 hypothetical protein [Chiayiivirga sp.]
MSYPALIAFSVLLAFSAGSGAQSRPASPKASDAAKGVDDIYKSTAAPASEAAAPPVLPVDSKLPAVMDRGMLVDRRGMTLYTYDGDRRPRVSTCYGLCEKLWQPFYAGTDDASVDDFAVIHRRDGSLQWAYHGKPLYYWNRDRKPGDATGDKVNDVWHLVPDTAASQP